MPLFKKNNELCFTRCLFYTMRQWDVVIYYALCLAISTCTMRCIVYNISQFNTYHIVWTALQHNPKKHARIMSKCLEECGWRCLRFAWVSTMWGWNWSPTAGASSKVRFFPARCHCRWWKSKVAITFGPNLKIHHDLKICLQCFHLVLAESSVSMSCMRKQVWINCTCACFTLDKHTLIPWTDACTCKDLHICFLFFCKYNIGWYGIV